MLLFTAHYGGFLMWNMFHYFWRLYSVFLQLDVCMAPYTVFYCEDVTCIILLLHGAPEHRPAPVTPQLGLSTGGGYPHSHLELVQTLGVRKRQTEGFLHAPVVTLSNNNKQESVNLHHTEHCEIQHIMMMMMMMISQWGGWQMCVHSTCCRWSCSELHAPDTAV